MNECEVSMAGGQINDTVLFGSIQVWNAIVRKGPAHSSNDIEEEVSEVSFS
jgi:hypothetical protein